MAILNKRLVGTDPDFCRLVEQEKVRQRYGLNLVANENFTSRAVLEALGSVSANKGSEGYTFSRNSGGDDIVDEIESLCQRRGLEVFQLDAQEWGVNVHSLSGSVANFQVRC